MKTTGTYSIKQYRCRTCGQMSSHGTNHWGAIYPYCNGCRSISILDCQEPVPEGFGIPEEWKIVKLGDICDIVEVK